MARIERFEDLRIWQEAREICRSVDDLLKSTYGVRPTLQNQMDSSAGSIMDNIAEGFERNGNKEFKQFLSIAKASCGELRSQLHRLEDRSPENMERIKELRKMTEQVSGGIQRLIEHLKRSELNGSKFEEDRATYNVAVYEP